VIPAENKKALLECAPENPASLDATEAQDAPHFSGVVHWTAEIKAVEKHDLFEEGWPAPGTIVGAGRRYMPPPPKGCTRNDAIKLAVQAIWQMGIPSLLRARDRDDNILEWLNQEGFKIELKTQRELTAFERAVERALKDLRTEQAK